MPFVVSLLTSLGVERYFTLIIGGGDCFRPKAVPGAMLYLVLSHLGLYACELLFISDSRNDLLVAKVADRPSTSMTYGYNYGEVNHLQSSG